MQPVPQFSGLNQILFLDLVQIQIQISDKVRRYGVIVFLGK